MSCTLSTIKAQLASGSTAKPAVLPAQSTMPMPLTVTRRQAFTMTILTAALPSLPAAATPEDDERAKRQKEQRKIAEQQRKAADRCLIWVKVQTNSRMSCYRRILMLMCLLPAEPLYGTAWGVTFAKQVCFWKLAQADVVITDVLAVTLQLQHSSGSTAAAAAAACTISPYVLMFCRLLA